MRETCPHCGNQLVSPIGPTNSPILFLAEFPGKEEVIMGVPWVGKAGDVFKAELGRAGLSYQYCRATNLWLHAPSKECDYEWHLQRAYEELQGRKAVLLMGSEVAHEFIDGPMDEWIGLNIKSKKLPKTVKVAVLSYNPAIAMHQPVGEVRYAIERFADLTKEIRRGE